MNARITPENSGINADSEPHISDSDENEENKEINLTYSMKVAVEEMLDWFDKKEFTDMSTFCYYNSLIEKAEKELQTALRSKKTNKTDANISKKDHENRAKKTFCLGILMAIYYKLERTRKFFNHSPLNKKKDTDIDDLTFQNLACLVNQVEKSIETFSRLNH